MASTNFLYQDAVTAARRQIADDSGRRVSDGDIELTILPRLLAQLRDDRPDLFLGAIDTVNLRPSLADPCAFDDSGYSAFVEAIVAAVQGVDEESMSGGTSRAADALSERSRRS